MDQKGYIKSLDGLRFLAVTLVLLDHWTNYKIGFPGSYLGVSLFFVLSGYLITGILIKAKQSNLLENRSHAKSLKLFYIRRTIRIFPLYYIVLFVLFLQNEQHIRSLFIWLITYQTNNYIAFSNNWMGSFDHFWSLAVEEQFYIFFPFLIFFVSNKVLPRVLWGLVLAAVLLRLYFYLNHFSWIVPFVLMPTSLDALGLGSLLAFYLHVFPQKAIFSNNRIKFGLAVSFILYCTIVVLLETQAPAHNFYSVVLLRFFESVFSVFLVFSFIKINDKSTFTLLKRSLFENKAVVFIGKISYGIYIYHHFVYNYYYSNNTDFIPRIFGKINQIGAGFGDNLLIRMCILFPIVLLISTISWFIFEKPINNLKDRFKY